MTQDVLGLFSEWLGRLIKGRSFCRGEEHMGRVLFHPVSNIINKQGSGEWQQLRPGGLRSVIGELLRESIRFARSFPPQARSRSPSSPPQFRV